MDTTNKISDFPAFDAQLIDSSARVRAVDCNAYGRGFLAGVEYAKEHLLDVEQAQLAVRLFRAAEVNEEAIRKDMRHTREFFAVERARRNARAA